MLHHVLAAYSFTRDALQVWAFRVRNLNFCARDARTTLALTTDQCGARSGAPIIHSFLKDCFIRVTSANKHVIFEEYIYSRMIKFLMLYAFSTYYTYTSNYNGIICRSWIQAAPDMMNTSYFSVFLLANFLICFWNSFPRSSHTILIITVAKIYASIYA